MPSGFMSPMNREPRACVLFACVVVATSRWLSLAPSLGIMLVGSRVWQAVSAPRSSSVEEMGWGWGWCSSTSEDPRGVILVVAECCVNTSPQPEISQLDVH